MLKDLKLRYRGSVLGFCWTLINPVALMAVYTLVFSVYLRVEVERYLAFLLAGHLHILLHTLTVLLFLTPVFFFGRAPALAPLVGVLALACVILWLAMGYFTRQKATFAEAP